MPTTCLTAGLRDAMILTLRGLKACSHMLTLLEQCQPCLSPSDGGLTLLSDELDHAQKIFGKMLVLVIGRVRQSHGILHESKLASISTTMPPQ